MRIGIIGCGQHATTVLLPAIARLGFELAAVCARRRDVAEAVAARFGAGMAYDDPQAMLRREGLDGAVVCTPPHTHAELTTICLDAGVPVFVEKPGAGSSAEAERVSKLSALVGVPVMVGYMKRFAPAYRRARECLTDDAFGRPSMARFTFVMGEFDGDLGTYLLDNTVHHLDLARYLVGELRDVRAALGSGSDRGRHALVITARAESGAVVSFQLGSTGSWFHHNEGVEIFGVGSSVMVDNVDTCVHRSGSAGETVWRPNYSIPIEQNDSSTVTGFGPELRHFRDVAMAGVTCESDIASASRTLALIEGIQAQVERPRAGAGD